MKFNILGKAVKVFKKTLNRKKGYNRQVFTPTPKKLSFLAFLGKYKAVGKAIKQKKSDF